MSTNTNSRAHTPRPISEISRNLFFFESPLNLTLTQPNNCPIITFQFLKYSVFTRFQRWVNRSKKGGKRLRNICLRKLLRKSAQNGLAVGITPVPATPHSHRTLYAGRIHLESIPRKNGDRSASGRTGITAHSRSVFKYL